MRTLNASFGTHAAPRLSSVFPTRARGRLTSPSVKKTVAGGDLVPRGDYHYISYGKPTGFALTYSTGLTIALELPKNGEITCPKDRDYRLRQPSARTEATADAILSECYRLGEPSSKGGEELAIDLNDESTLETAIKAYRDMIITQLNNVKVDQIDEDSVEEILRKIHVRMDANAMIASKKEIKYPHPLLLEVFGNLIGKECEVQNRKLGSVPFIVDVPHLSKETY